MVDSEVLVTKAHVRALVNAGYSITEAQLVDRFLGVSDRHMYAEIEREIGRALPGRYHKELSEHLQRMMAAELSPVPGVADALSRLRHPACVASSSTSEMLAFKLHRTDLLHRFEGRVFSVDDVRLGKPAPDLFLHAARRLGVEPNACVVIEDSVNGIRAARDANMRAIGFVGASHIPEGYGQRLRDAGAEAVFPSFQRLSDEMPELFTSYPG
ncbi:HAD family hydrolase [Qipengyuania sp.]|uniref:HAD family hydrolase n=1 Tax=Qipengyuania sp. TaxID=2004515 RepID=UPI003BAAACDB